MPLTLSGYVLHYPELDPLLSTIPPDEVIKLSGSNSTSLLVDGELESNSQTASADVLNRLGPVDWLNKWLEKEGMGSLLQAVPLYDPSADQPISTADSDSSRPEAENGQKLLLVRKCVMEMVLEEEVVDAETNGRTTKKLGTSTPISLRNLTQSPAALLNNAKISPTPTPISGASASNATGGRRDSGLVEAEQPPSDVDPQKEREIREWIVDKLLLGRKKPDELKWASVVDPDFEEV